MSSLASTSKILNKCGLSSAATSFYSECEFCTGLFPLEVVTSHVKLCHRMEQSWSDNHEDRRRVFACTDVSDVWYENEAKSNEIIVKVEPLCDDYDQLDAILTGRTTQSIDQSYIDDSDVDVTGTTPVRVLPQPIKEPKREHQATTEENSEDLAHVDTNLRVTSVTPSFGKAATHLMKRKPIRVARKPIIVTRKPIIVARKRLVNVTTRKPAIQLDTRRIRVMPRSNYSTVAKPIKHQRPSCSRVLAIGGRATPALLKKTVNARGWPYVPWGKRLFQKIGPFCDEYGADAASMSASFDKLCKVDSELYPDIPKIFDTRFVYAGLNRRDQNFVEFRARMETREQIRSWLHYYSASSGQQYHYQKSQMDGDAYFIAYTCDYGRTKQCCTADVPCPVNVRFKMAPEHNICGIQIHAEHKHEHTCTWHVEPEKDNPDRPSNETRAQFESYFRSGLRIPHAYEYHERTLRKRPDFTPDMLEDRRIMPTYRQAMYIYNLFTKAHPEIKEFIEESYMPDDVEEFGGVCGERFKLLQQTARDFYGYFQQGMQPAEARAHHLQLVQARPDFTSSMLNDEVYHPSRRRVANWKANYRQRLRAKARRLTDQSQKDTYRPECEDEQFGAPKKYKKKRKKQKPEEGEKEENIVTEQKDRGAYEIRTVEFLGYDSDVDV